MAGGYIMKPNAVKLIGILNMVGFLALISGIVGGLTVIKPGDFFATSFFLVIISIGWFLLIIRVPISPYKKFFKLEMWDNVVMPIVVTTIYLILVVLAPSQTNKPMTIISVFQFYIIVWVMSFISDNLSSLAVRIGGRIASRPNK